MIYEEIEGMCSTIKHFSESVDLYEVRSLLRKAQYMISSFEPFMSGNNLTICQTPDGEGWLAYQVTLSAELTREQLDNMFAAIADHRGLS